jgi:acyl carrier protein
MTRTAEISQSIHKSIKQYLGVELRSDDEHIFAEAKVDSLAFLNVIASIERQYGVKFANDALPNYHTCAQLAAAVAELQSPEPR